MVSIVKRYVSSLCHIFFPLELKCLDRLEQGYA
jgi:hypothetical protein